jgi:beta-lactam-binding protein with PASTA domain
MAGDEPRWKGLAAVGTAGFAVAVIGFLVLYGVGVLSIGGSGGDNGGPTPTPAIAVPNVVGLPSADARQRLEALGLRVATEFVYGEGSPGIVTDERIPEIAETQPGDRITLMIARSVAKVPSVTGMTKTAATRELERYGYDVLVRRVRTSSTDAGRVLSTLPAAGTRQQPHTTVMLRIAVPPRCDPNYTGYCVPNVSYDLNCGDIGHMVRVVGIDRFGFDGDGNGWGCEAYG